MSAGEADGRRVGEELLLITAYLLSSGRGLLEEPPQYGTFRCLDAARRVLALAERTGPCHPELDALRAWMDDVMCGAMADHELDVLLDQLCDRLAAVLEDPDVISA
ncbi:DUF6092 family protein [Nocardiopsis halotolerans]|uniref:DUF6092 family protein n=1 Tax=Nocardiopsis halotolerans TaxID=124252 RepID=UPI00034AD762|nr:DUF6092 family protein [Nocardiopsis halotolerans]